MCCYIYPTSYIETQTPLSSCWDRASHQKYRWNRQFQNIPKCSTNRSVNLRCGLPPTPLCSHWLFNFSLSSLRTHCVVTVKWNTDSPISRRSNLSDFLSFKWRRHAFLDTDHPGHESFMRGSRSRWHLFNYNHCYNKPPQSHRAWSLHPTHDTYLFPNYIAIYSLSVCADEDKIFF